MTYFDEYENLVFTNSVDKSDPEWKNFIASIKRRKKRFAELLVLEKSGEKMKNFLLLWKKVSLDDINEYLEMSTKNDAGEVTAVLLEYKRGNYSDEEVEKHENIKAEKALGTKELSLADWRKTYRVKIENDEAVISKYKGCDSYVEIPAFIGKNKVTKIGKEAFNCNTEVESVTVPEGVNEIEFYAFSKCKNLKNVTIPETVTKMGFGIFFGCISLEKVTLPEHLEEISQCAFDKCTNLKEVHIRGKNTKIHWHNFKDSKDFIIYASEGSIAEDFALKHKIPFVAE